MAVATWIQRLVDAPDKAILTAADVAALFGYDSEDSVMRMVEAGILPRPLKRGAMKAWDWEDVMFAKLRMKLDGRLECEPQPAPAKRG